MLSIFLIAQVNSFCEEPTEAVLKKYLSAIERRDFKTAYELLSQKDKESQTIDEFSLPYGDEGTITALFISLIKYDVVFDRRTEDKVFYKVKASVPEVLYRSVIAIYKTYSEMAEKERIDFLEKQKAGTDWVEITNFPMTLIKEEESWRIYFDSAEMERWEKAEKELADKMLREYKDKVILKEIKFIDNEFTVYYFISGIVQNKTGKVITGLAITFYGLDENNNPIFEKEERLIYSTRDPDLVLKPNHKKKFDFTLERSAVPKNWIKKYKIEVTSLELMR